MSSDRVLSTPRKIFYALVIFLAVPLIYLFAFKGMRFFLVPSKSMEPTIRPSDYLMTLEDDEYRRGDIVVFRDPASEGEYLVKRIIGLPGDVISIHGGAVFINGAYASEPYRMEPIDYTMDDFTVPEGELFILGDNSNWSVDSHNWGADSEPGDHGEKKGRPTGIPEENIVGRVKYIYLPWARRGSIERYPLTNVHGQ